MQRPRQLTAPLFAVLGVAVACAGGSDATPNASEASCPAPGHDPDWTCFQTERWARDPLTGDCCRYGAVCEAPAGWAVFESEAECQTDCRCQSVEPFRAEPFSPGIAHEALACDPDGGGESAAQIGRDLCGLDAGPIELALGCGQVRVLSGSSFSFRGWVFDAATGRRIGEVSAADELALPCRTSVTISGTAWDCAEATHCMICGDNSQDYSSCGPAELDGLR